MYRLNIRPVQVSDAMDLQRICSQDEVVAYTMFSPSIRVDTIENRIRNMGQNHHEFVADIEGRVYGFVGLMVGQNARRSHVGDLYLAVDRDYHRRGMGKALITKALELADEWLMLERVELGVLATNPGAKELYEKVGFQMEGVKQGSIKSRGQYVDEILMARLHPDGLIVNQGNQSAVIGG
ncbi:GNAT family N-acetyltransferase [Paenibacillus sp. N1-5-1-14]|uniref:GNAT family N-acetyltransferase n=1 Tax=Paenibacillus radicibacter TaxID=2972488 RepID=UPI002158F42C|nr:GNAT family N-acetyltransferase [Paenibacillus radicibacter]MCR8641189.1 GNAT family N-acetyltransferase [Paenibacillus radicibacter]